MSVHHWGENSSYNFFSRTTREVDKKLFSEPNFIQTLETSTPSVLLLVKSSLSRSLAQVTFEECYPLNS